MNSLSISEFALAKDIIHKGLVSAARQLTFFMKDTVDVIEIDLKLVENPLKASLSALEQNDGKLNILLTDIIGELGGCCFLVLTEGQANSLRNRALPPDIARDSPFYQEMKDAILLEVDNIITASVITQFANMLQKSLHGSVPRLLQAEKETAENLITERANKNMHRIEFYAKFYSSTIDFKPLFIWYLDDKFIACIKMQCTEIKA